MTRPLISDDKDRRQKALELTGYLLRKYYCENDMESLISLFDDQLHWIGTGEQEYEVGAEKVSQIFQQFTEQIPRCNISEEHYDATEIGPDIYLCTGRAWIATDPSTSAYLRVHQRITAIFRWIQDEPYCCHIHMSNPNAEMVEGDVGFPAKMARQSYEYMQSCIEQQKKQIEEQTAELVSIYNTVPCAIMRFRRTKDRYQLLTFNRALADMLELTEEQVKNMDWSNGICENVVKEDVPQVIKLLGSLRNQGDHNIIDYRLKNKSGEMIYISSNNSLISEEEEGAVLQRIAFDITEQVELEQLLERKSYEDTLTGLFNRNKFNQVMRDYMSVPRKWLGLAYFDINGLKVMNDTQGHSAGDSMICRAACHISRFFAGKTYRIGGDEFVVIDEESSEEAFIMAIEQLGKELENDGLSLAAGYSWRSTDCDIERQFEEADRRMYQDKEQFYKRQGRLAGRKSAYRDFEIRDR